MFLPIGDSPNPEGFTPYVTWGIIAANIAVFLFISLPLSGQAPSPAHPLLEEYVRMLLSQGVPVSHIKAILAQASLNDLFLYHYGYKPANPDIVSLFASLFLHSGYMHLFGNMLFLFIYGDNVEYQMGRLKYLLMYLAAGVIATISFALLAGDSMTPLVGASGAISGVLGFYFYMFPKNKVKVFILLFPIFMNVVRIPARIVLGIYVVLDNILPLLSQAGGNVAHGAHLGGFFGGLGIAVAGEYFGWQSPFAEDSRLRMWFKGRSKKQQSAKKESFSAALRTAAARDNVNLLLNALKNSSAGEISSLELEDILVSSRTLKKHGLHEPACRILKIALSTHKFSQDLAEVYYELGDSRMQQGFPTAAYQHLLTALELKPKAAMEDKIRSLLKQVHM